MDSGDPSTTEADASAAAEAPVVFRGKKRKFFRQKPAEEAPATETDEPAAATESEGIPKIDASDPGEEGLSVAEIIRRRNARKHRLKGVGFSADEASAAAQADDELSIMIREEEQKAMELSNGGVNRRFTAQTGLSSDLSKLQEIDLGDEVRSRNEAMTERARRMLQGEAVEDEQAARPKKVRLGRDGKPWRPRNRRNSDAIKRDQLVEEILRESRLDVYETSTPPAAATPGPDDDGATDDRIAEEFKREFMEAMAERQQKRRPATNATTSKTAKKDEDVLKGPKLGGSRNSRAAMRDLMLRKEKEGKK
ncbi:hypothetical protein KJ359_003000 [Pestalotiopsis sp. 9143b]|nr:hypothetical protein KJ359_003000 [Pestalotiopsis sp. 9143b]